MIVDAAEASLAADQRDAFLDAFSTANSLVITARFFPVLFFLTLLPFVKLVGLFGVATLLIWVPASALRWYHRYGKFTSDDPEYPKVRSWVRQALTIWVVALIATPLWVWFFIYRW